MLKTSRLRFLSFLVLVVCSIAIGAQYGADAQGQMVLLGSGRVNAGVDHDTIQVGQQSGTYRAIQLRVNGGAVNFLRIIVQYGNGTREEIQVRSTIPSGGSSRIIDLPGARRIIQRVDFWYTRAQWATLPKVSLYGVK